MKIYLIDRTDECGYEEHDSTVIIARDEDHVREIINEKNETICSFCGLYATEKTYKYEGTVKANITIKEIKLNKDNEGILLSSYNAG